MSRRTRVLTTALRQPEDLADCSALQWELLLRHARAAGVLAPLAERLTAIGLMPAIPPGPARALAAAQATAVQWRTLLCHRLADAHARLASVGVAAVPVGQAAWLADGAPGWPWPETLVDAAAPGASGQVPPWPDATGQAVGRGGPVPVGDRDGPILGTGRDRPVDLAAPGLLALQLAAGQLDDAARRLQDAGWRSAHSAWPGAGTVPQPIRLVLLPAAGDRPPVARHSHPPAPAALPDWWWPQVAALWQQPQPGRALHHLVNLDAQLRSLVDRPGLDAAWLALARHPQRGATLAWALGWLQRLLDTPLPAALAASAWPARQSVTTRWWQGCWQLAFDPLPPVGASPRQRQAQRLAWRLLALRARRAVSSDAADGAFAPVSAATAHWLVWPEQPAVVPLASDDRAPGLPPGHEAVPAAVRGPAAQAAADPLPQPLPDPAREPARRPALAPAR